MSFELDNPDGAIIDLGPGENKDVGTLDNVMDESLNYKMDPATSVLQKVIFFTKLPIPITFDHQSIMAMTV